MAIRKDREKRMAILTTPGATNADSSVASLLKDRPQAKAEHQEIEQRLASEATICAASARNVSVPATTECKGTHLRWLHILATCRIWSAEVAGFIANRRSGQR